MKDWKRLFIAVATLGCLGAHADPGETALAAAESSPESKVESKPVARSDSKAESNDETSANASQNETKPLGKIEALRLKVKRNSKDFETRMQLADELEKASSKPKSPSHASEIVDLLKPYNDRLPRKGLIILARAYGKLKDSVGELRSLELCMAKNPNDYVVQTMLGDAYARAKRGEEAATAFLKAKEINSKYLPAYEGLLKELERTGERYEARTLLNDMVKTFGPQPRFFTDLCRLYTLDAFLEKSVEVCRKAIEKDPRTPENFVYLGTSLRDQEEPDQAAKVLSQASQRFPASEPVQTAAGELRAQKNDYVGAYRLFKLAVKADPKSSRALLGYANAAFELQKHDEAMDAYIKACKADRKAVSEFRVAWGKLRARKDTQWANKYESSLTQCY